MKTSTTSSRLKEYLSITGLKQVDIVNKCKPYCEQYDIKFNKSDISQYVTGRAEPNQDKLYILSVALGVKVEWIMGFDVPMYDNNHELTNDSLVKYFGDNTIYISKYMNASDDIKKEINDFIDFKTRK